MATTTDIKNGLCINFNNDIYTIVEFLHVKPGKGAAFVRTKMRNVKTGRMLENTFPSGAKIDIVRVERRPYTYLYKEGDMHVFMHTETYEQIYIPETIINAPQCRQHRHQRHEGRHCGARRAGPRAPLHQGRRAHQGRHPHLRVCRALEIKLKVEN